MKKQQICILGSTGSIGVQALDVIRQHPDLYEVYCLTANNSVDRLAQQAHEFNPAAVVIANASLYGKLCSLLADRPDIKVYAGAEALNEIVEAEPIDAVLASMVGFSGLVPTIRAIKAHKKICLANKETLVVAGELILSLVEQYHVDLLPVDSEHSAIFQCLVGEDINAVDKILLTCSGGPFRQFTHEQLQQVTAADALKHPTWRMGAIEVLIHPQSVIHSGVQFLDGVVKAQLGVPDMRLPIQYAFSYPRRLHLNGDRLDLFKTQHLDFIKPDINKFRCLALAYEAIHQGGNMPCILNAANEVANLAFREGRCTFLGMADVIEKTMQQAAFDGNPTLDTYLQTDAEARRIAQSLLT